MSSFLKKFAAVFLAAGVAVLGLAGYYAHQLPDSYKLGQDSSFDLNTLFTVSAKPCGSDIAAGAETYATHSRNTLMLFGTVPIKDVETAAEARPMLVPCGEPFGIKLITDGVLVVDLQETSGKCAARDCGIQKGDVLLSIDGKVVKSNEDVAAAVAQSGGKPCTVSYKRSGTKKTAKLIPDLIGGQYRAGMWVRDSSAGIGTMTFYDSSTGCFGGLGHPICDADIKTPLPLSRGVTGEIKLNEYVKSRKGSPGWLTGDFVNSSSTGTIFKNCENGVFGTLYSPPETTRDALPMGYRQELHEGEALMLTSIDNNGAKGYKVRISDISLAPGASHDFTVEITDKALLDSAGGILQGMSGSPIIQDGRLVGAVTHVLVDKPKYGYGIFADRMYEQLSDIPRHLSDAA